MSEFDELIDEVINSSLNAENDHEWRGKMITAAKTRHDVARTALTDAISAVTSERDKLKSELNKWEDWPKEYDALKEMRIQSNQNSFACKQAYIIALEFELKHSNKERDKWVELEKTRADLLLQTTGNRNIEMLAKDYNRLKAKLAEANEENKRLLEAINNIANLGLQKLPVDKRWGTAFAIAREVLHRARVAKDES